MQRQMVWEAFRTTAVLLGFLIAILGLVHQFRSRKALAFMNLEGKYQSRAFVLGWLSKGAFLSFCGISPALLLLLYSREDPSLLASLLLHAAALLFLAFYTIHSRLSGQLPGLRTAALLEICYGLYLILFVVLAPPL